MKKNRIQDAFLAHLRKVPIVQVACEKVDVSRNSVYKWRKVDPEFAKRMEEALAEGEALINDMSESQLLSLIGEKHWPALAFWLSRRNPKFRERVDVRATFDGTEDVLTPAQEAIVRKALELSVTHPNTHRHG